MKNKFTYIISCIMSLSLLMSAESKLIDINNPVNCSGNCYEPIANAGESKTYFQGSTVILDGSLSYDPEGESLTYLWSAPDGISLSDNTLQMPTFTAPNEDVILSFSLIVNDGEYNSTSAQVDITVVVINTPPELVIDENYEMDKFTEFTLDASGANDDNSLTGVLDFIWDYPDFTLIDNSTTSIITLLSPDVIDDQNTAYPITLTVTDGEDPLIINISVVVRSNIVPFAVPGNDMEVSVSSEFTLFGSTSFDVDETGELTYNWDYTDCTNQNFITNNIATDADIVFTAPDVAGITCSASLVVNDGVINSSEWSGEELFISEYVESSSTTDNYIEIYNGTNLNIDLSEYTLKITKNNGTDQWSVQLNDNSGDSNNNGILEPGATIFVLKSDGGDLCNEDYLDCDSGGVQWIEFANINKYSGDEAIELYKCDGACNIDGDDNIVNGEPIDVIGTPGNDPGGGWNVAGVDEATSEHTLVRADFVTSGNLDWEESAGTNSNDSEWIVEERNMFDYGGSHLNTYCDNFVNITTVTNDAPTATIETPASGLSLVPGAEITLSGSATDPEGDELSYLWTVVSDDEDGVSISNETTLSPTIMVLEDFDTNQGQNFVITFEVNDGANVVTSSLAFIVEIVNANPTINYQVEECEIGCWGDDDFGAIDPNSEGEYEVLEGYTIRVNASSSSDNTSTGELIYSWNLPFLDIDGDGTNDLDISGNNTEKLSLEIPEYVVSDRMFSFMLTLSDGDNSLDGVFEGFQMVVLAQMPIIGTIEETGNMFEFDDESTSYIPQAGFPYEGFVIELDGSSTSDPDGDNQDLDFNWTRVSSEGTSILGVCQDGSGNLENIPCSDDDDCASTCNLDTYIAYLELPIHNITDQEFTVRLQVVDADNNSSEQAESIITGVARYPFAHAGYDFEVVAGEEVLLSGYLSVDNQEEEVKLGSYTSPGTWDEATRSLISGYVDYELVAFENYIFTWTQESGLAIPDFELIENDVSPVFQDPGTTGDAHTMEFSLIVVDPEGLVSEQSTVTVEVLEDEPPSVDAGDDFRSAPSNLVFLNGSGSLDETPKGDLVYLWTSDDELSFDNEDDCEENNGSWNNGSCNIMINDATLPVANLITPAVDFGQELILNFTLTITNDTGDDVFVDSDGVTVTVINLSRPVSPSLNAYPEHGQITLYWDDISESAIDSLTQYADFQGYRLYKSSDYGNTWGESDDLIVSEAGDTLGWTPLAIYHLSEEQDNTYCVYKPGNENCDKTRGVPIYGADPYQNWFDLGDPTEDEGLFVTFVDTNVIDGIDYVYTITAYDGGLHKGTEEFGSYNDLTGIWEDEVDHNFTEHMIADYYEYNKLEYPIIDSYIDDDTDDYIYQLEIPDGYPPDFSIAERHDSWPSSNPDGYYIGLQDVEDEKEGYKSLESSKGYTSDDPNYVQVSPGYASSNVIFPEISNIDDFLTPDCRAIGNGTKRYEIVNLGNLTKSLVKLEIQADSNADTFLGYASEDPCLYAYHVIPIQEDNTRLYYRPISLTADLNSEDEEFSIIEYESLVYDEGDDEYYYLVEGDLETYEGLPGVDISYLEETCVDGNGDPIASPCILIPEYSLDCFPLEYEDDSDYTNNYTPFIDGIRLRFDNAVKNEPQDKVAVLKDVYSYPDSSLVNSILLDQAAGATVELQYYTSFTKKPSFDYEVELNSTYVSESLDPGSNCPEDETVGAKLPFKIKNLTTGKYVVLKHNDNGIFDGNPPTWWQGDEPGVGDCMWQPGELVYFQRDTVLVGTPDNLVLDEDAKTFALNMTYSPSQITCCSSLCSDYEYYTDVGNYDESDCVYYEGMIWYATDNINAIDDILPNQWIYNSSTDSNDNPWIPVYPWDSGTRIVLKTKKWYIDGDYWVADMSLLGQGTSVTQDDMDNIKVVPNPYIVYSNYNQTTNGLRFTHLPQECTITIYTISGEVVDIINHSDNFDGDHFWYLKNKHGVSVAPGLYIYRVVEKETELEFIGKFAVVK